MSVDKFGRSSLTVNHRRRTIPLTPSRQLLQSVGVLCRTGNYVDFKSASARNLGIPLQPLDAATKDYVDRSIKSVQSTAQAAVTENLEYVISSTFKLTQNHLDEKLKSLNVGFKTIIEKTVEDKVGEKSRVAAKKIDEAVNILETYKRYRETEDSVATNNMLKYDNDLAKFKKKLELQDGRLDRVDDAYTMLTDRVKILENRPTPIRRYNKTKTVE